MSEAEIEAAVRAYQEAFLDALDNKVGFKRQRVRNLLEDPFRVRAVWLGLCAAWRTYREGERQMVEGDL